MTPTEAKAKLRPALVARILGMDPIDRAEQESSLVSKLPTLLGIADANRVLLYVRAFPEEIDTGPMIRFVLDQGKTLICPRVFRSEKRLRLFQIQDLARDFERGTLGIPEPRVDCPEIQPDEVDWVLVPGLGFDRRGFRIGRGAGYYDRLLPQLRPEVPRWGLILTTQWVENLPIESHDQPLDGVADFGQVVAFDRR